MSVVTAGEVRGFIVSHLADSLRENNLAGREVADDFDLKDRGIIDSIGYLQLITAIEEHFGIEIDFGDMDAENLTVIGSMSRYIEERAEKG
jgi:acyl carrier protein